MSHYECPNHRRAGVCRWPVKDIPKAQRAALRILQINLGRLLTEVELKTLASSEPWHAFLWHAVRGIPVALRWHDILMVPGDAEPGEHPYADNAHAIEEMLLEAFAEKAEPEPKVDLLAEARQREPRPRRFV